MATIGIIGAGHGGLAAAARLRVKGHDVTIFEKNKVACTTLQPLTLPAAYRDFFLKTGSALEKNLDLAELQFAIELPLKNGQKLGIPASGLGRVLTAIEHHLGSIAAEQWRNYIQPITDLWISVRKDLVESQMTKSIRGTIGWKNYWLFRNYQNLVTKNLKVPELIELTKIYRDQCATSPKSNIGVLALNSYVQQIFGVYQPVGGPEKLTDALVNRCAELGVNFEFNCPAIPVAANKQLIGIELNQGKLSACDFLVINELEKTAQNIYWNSKPNYQTDVARLFVINEYSWLGLGPAHAVLGGQIVAELIGSAPD